MRLPRSQNGWPPWKRLRRGADFRRTFRAGQRVELPLFSVIIVASPPGQDAGRLGLAVSRRFGGAVQRNRIKRALREAFRRLGPVGLDAVVLPRPKARGARPAQVRDALTLAFDRVRTRPSRKIGTRPPASR